jgi:predicted transglutaminase-like cysteine proteinase
MRSYARWCLGLVLVAAPAAAAPPEGKIVLETWETAYLQGNKTGYVHTVTRETEKDGRKLLHTSKELHLTVRRFGNVVDLRMLTGDSETADGKVVGVFMKQFLGKEQALQVEGTVNGGNLDVTVVGQGKNFNKSEPWNDEVISLYRQERLFHDRKVKPGDKVEFDSFSPEATTVIHVRAEVKDYEEFTVAGKKKQKLLRVELLPEKVQDVQLPGLMVWLDDNLMRVRSQVDMPGLGNLILVRTTRETAHAPANIANMADIGVGQLIWLRQRINQPYQTQQAVYRITVKGDKDPATTFARDGRQSIHNINGNSFELEVKAKARPDDVANAAAAGSEYLKSCYFIKCDDPIIQKDAKLAVGGEPDPWRQALRIERWVNRNMQKQNFSEAFATADHVARTLEGDCTECAVFTAAICRAAGVPSRTAVGLLYIDDPSGKPAMGFHMWTEVFVHGQWMSIDATLGQGFVDATHLKIADQSWYNVQSLTPLLPLLRVLGKVRIEVLEVNGRR